MPLKRPFQKKSSRKPSRSRTNTSRKSTSKSTSRTTSRKPQAPLPPLFNLSEERKLDVIGIFLALCGVILLLTLLSASRSSLTGALVGGLTFFFGWNVYLLALGLLLIGGWLVLRKVENVPSVSVERITGLVLLFFFIQVDLQGFIAGGGWFGALLYGLMTTWFGENGTLVILFAWMLIALTMAFDLTIPELLAKFKPFYSALAKLVSTLLARLLGRFPGGSNAPDALPAQDGFTPLNRPAVAPSAAENAAGTPPTPAGSAPTRSSAASAPIAWTLPPIKDILESGEAQSANQEFVEQRARLIEETLSSFGAPAQVVEINRGPTITQFGVEPLFVESRSGRMRVRVSKIVALADDLALALAAPRIRIQAPVPGRSYVGIEVPNDEMTLVNLRDILESESFNRARKSLSFSLGRDVSGHPIAADLASMPHLLIAGTTGSGKSVCVNSILTCLLLYNTPDDLRLILVDPKRVELTNYNGIPHLLAPVVVEMDRVIGALQWMTREMDRRYHIFAQVGARNIADYNTRMKTQGGKKMYNVVVVIDELADLMMIAPDETERTITRLAQLARATGIHLILATQRPSVDVVTGLIKANFPARVAFAVASNTDSRVILDQPGAERLLGRGDMLYQAPDAPAPVRLQGVFVSDNEIHRLADFWRAQNPQATASIPGGPVDNVPANVPLKQVPMFDDMTPQEQSDPLLTEAIDLIRREGRASVSMLQRKLRIGYTRAARLIDTMEEKKIIGSPQDATGVRPVLDYGPAAPPHDGT